jgi:hypothetical protein
MKKYAKDRLIYSGKVGFQAVNLVSCSYCKHLLQFGDSIMRFMMPYTHFPHFFKHKNQKAHFCYNLYTTTNLIETMEQVSSIIPVYTFSSLLKSDLLLNLGLLNDRF